MSQAYEEKISLLTHDTGTELRFKQIEVVTVSTETKQSETQVYSLGHPKNETLKDFDKQMEQISENSLENWEE